MSSVQKVSIALSPELLAVVKDAVATGRYASASEVVREALRGWQAREELREIELDRLRAAWRAGIESGEPAPFDVEDVKTKARERLARLSRTPLGE